MPPKNGKARTFDHRVGAGFDECEIRERVTRDQAFVAKLNQPVGHLAGIKSEVLRGQALAAAPKADRSRNEDTALTDGIEKRIGECVGIHGLDGMDC